MGRRLSLALQMQLTALVGLDLALLRAMPAIAESPPFFFIFSMLNIVLVQAIILRRPLRAFHYTFLVVGILSSIAMTVLAYRESRPAMGSLHILETSIHWYRDARGGSRVVSLLAEFPMLSSAERWITCALALLPAWAAGLLAARLMPRQHQNKCGWGRRVALFLQGALIGFGLFSIWGLVTFYLGKTLHEPHTAWWYAHRGLLVACPLLGGVAVLSLRGITEPVRVDTEPPVAANLPVESNSVTSAG